jgi:hypothetical protein
MTSQSASYPNLPVPAPLRGIEVDSFARYTVTQRLPGIARRVLSQTDWPVPVARSLQALIDEIPHSRLRPLADDGAPDVAEWLTYLEPYLGQDWLWTPWFVVEMYFFRRILEATSYYRPGATQDVDPYTVEKQAAHRGW